MRDLVSVILPVYNGEAYLSEAINSVLNQSYGYLELIIVDDASSDSSLKIAQGFSLKDERVRIISNSNNLSLPVSLNIGHRQAKGRYITWTSDDNILKPNFIKVLYENIIKEQCDVIYSNYDIVWEDGRYKRTNITGPVAGLIFENVIGASFLYKMNVYESVKGYNEELFLVEDFFFFLKASLQFKFHHLSENLYQYRLHLGSLSKQISSDRVFKKRHRAALEMMFELISQELNFSKRTEKFILDLHFSKKFVLLEYLNQKKNLKEDIQKYQQKVQGNNGNSINILMSKVRFRWQKSQEEHTLKNLKKVLMQERGLLIVPGFNWISTSRLILSCLSISKTKNLKE